MQRPRVPPQAEVARNIASHVRELKPQVVVTFDPIGGYRHPDHIAIHQATVKAFNAVRSTSPSDAPQKLYYAVFPRTFLKLVVKILPLFGRDPRRFGPYVRTPY